MLHFERTNPENGFHPQEPNRIIAGMQDNLSRLLAGEMCREDAMTYVASLMEQQEEKSREFSDRNAVQNKGLSPEYRGGESMSSLSADLVGKMSKMMTDQSIPGGTLVFVYGTLMTGRANYRHFMTGAVSVGAGELYGYAMYDLGAYPGIKLSRKDTVKGELFLVDEQTLVRLDMLEGNGSLYDRVHVEVRGEPADALMAQTYAYRGSVRADRKVKKGDQPWGKIDVEHGTQGLSRAERFSSFVN